MKLPFQTASDPNSTNLILNAAGEMIAKWYYELENKYPGIRCREMVDWFKTMTTNEYIRGVKIQGWKRFNGKLWQRNYWEHIIRDDGSYSRIAAYILQNPSKWKDDQLYPRS